MGHAAANFSGSFLAVAAIVTLRGFSWVPSTLATNQRPTAAERLSGADLENGSCQILMPGGDRPDASGRRVNVDDRMTHFSFFDAPGLLM